MATQNVMFETNSGSPPPGSRQNYSASIKVNDPKKDVKSVITDGPVPDAWQATSGQLNPAVDGVTVTLFLPSGSSVKLTGNSTKLDKIDLNKCQIQATK